MTQSFRNLGRLAQFYVHWRLSYWSWVQLAQDDAEATPSQAPSQGIFSQSPDLA